jgi:hypothetical protein
MHLVCGQRLHVLYFHFEITDVLGHRARATVFALLLLLSPYMARADGSSQYGYDSVGRLSSALYDNGLCGFYAYDANGNRTLQEYVALVQSPPVWGSSVWGSFNWTTTPQVAVWGSGRWGCFKWTPQ